MDAKEIIQQELIKMVMRQTDYSEEEAVFKLKEHNNNYMNVIRESLGIKKSNKKDNLTTINQQIYKEIRGMMDTAANNYRIKQERQKLLEKIYEERQKQSATKD